MQVYVIIFSRYRESSKIKAICKDLDTAISRTKNIIFYNFPWLEEKEIDEMIKYMTALEEKRIDLFDNCCYEIEKWEVM